jgi:hypothetical protein
VLTLISSAVGAGVLSFPFALRCTGWEAGLACIAGIAATEAYTLYVLSKMAQHTGASSYSALVRRGAGGELGASARMRDVIPALHACRRCCPHMNLSRPHPPPARCTACSGGAAAWP